MKKHKFYKPVKQCLRASSLKVDKYDVIIEFNNKPLFIIHNGIKNRFTEICNGELFLQMKKHFKCSSSMDGFIRETVEEQFRVSINELTKDA